VGVEMYCGVTIEWVGGDGIVGVNEFDEFFLFDVEGVVLVI